MTGKQVTVLMQDGMVHDRAHWASDLSGEEQPAFEGWFIQANEDHPEYGYRGIQQPIGWREISPAPSKAVADSDGNAPGKHFGPD